ncbi:hypothetical protein NF212_20305 [Parasalinivibrio latis]|uniref:hypothetical protein n=1 Tax=Parasalinivibrio latis TaxID=2952610 RepID=UPI0030E1E022
MKMRVPTWTIVATGLALNIISALMTNFYIDEATEDVSFLGQEQVENNKRIALIWQQVETIERKRENLLVLFAQKDIPDSIMTETRSNLERWLQNTVPPLSLSTLPDVMASIDNAQALRREEINGIYLANIELAEKQTSQMKELASLRNLSLFLQLIGLCLILARDLNRK